MSILRLSHITHCISISISVHIIICVLNPHSGLNIASAHPHSFVQAWIKPLPGVTQHTLHPREKRPQNSPKRNVQADYKRQHKNDDNTKQGHSMTRSHLWSCTNTHSRMIQTAHVWFLEGRHHSGGISSGGKT